LNAYADTSFLVSLYTQDANSPRAIASLRTLREPLPFTPFHRLEFRNAIRQRVFRGELTAAERSAALQDLDDDLQDGVLIHAPVPWTATLREAERLGATHTETLGVRSADILHVAAALMLDAKELLSFDVNQRKLAAAEGLQVRP
jgi:predicted nucleic acid-binding protein